MAGASRGAATLGVFIAEISVESRLFFARDAANHRAAAHNLAMLSLHGEPDALNCDIPLLWSRIAREVLKKLEASLCLVKSGFEGFPCGLGAV